ncbi:purine-binding chemotaxis protein CheW [Pseudomonas sp. CFBP 8770]|uniref:chemotaxis protein CheW n=1 Tax=unclassified Pseudomonas TaxID=196821 RepID=UPI000F01668E|nr:MULTISPECIES: chemotaxis protein CheW [unclassified Pseudomonas]MBD8473859.1 purine-binding chemotaxis protein CheW [Pseudomonas sp. CFBP 8773]MBD8603131.1 purine-binding chemotaxis protein CheW [Pseudomonas sp. CFBP 8771]MBD8646988.1 purine-binding chemotaxis protein CheW [Pseudomonas sp. CFBP 8770]
MLESRTAFDLLLDIDQRCRLLAAELPSQELRLQTWSGIGFRLAGHWYVAPMGEVAEVLPEPRSTRLPGVRPWVVGVSNLRGRLLPVIDLGGFFGHGLSPQRKQHRVLVVDRADIFVGLLVDEVAGLQHFSSANHQASLPETALAAAAPFLQGHFLREHPWCVFSPARLVQAPAFLDVAL